MYRLLLLPGALLLVAPVRPAEACSPAIGVAAASDVTGSTPVNGKLMVELYLQTSPLGEASLRDQAGQEHMPSGQLGPLYMFDADELAPGDIEGFGGYGVHARVAVPFGVVDEEAPAAPSVTTVERGRGYGCSEDLSYFAVSGFGAPDHDVVGYALYREGRDVAVDATISRRQLFDLSRGRDGDGCYVVRAFDAAGNLSPPSPTVCGGGCMCLAPTGAAGWLSTLVLLAPLALRRPLRRR